MGNWCQEDEDTHKRCYFPGAFETVNRYAKQLRELKLTIQIGEVRGLSSIASSKLNEGFIGGKATRY